MPNIKYIFLITAFLSSTILAASTPQPTKKKKMTFQEMINSASGSSKQRPTVAGVRGLEETNGDIDTKARDFAAIDRLDQLAIHEDELKRFVDEGKLH